MIPIIPLSALTNAPKPCARRQVGDFAAVVAAAREAGVEWTTVEQDRMRHLSPWESITCSYLNLKARGWT